MTTSNYSYSHEQKVSPERAALLARSQRVGVAAKYLQDVAVYTDPAIWQQANTGSAGGANLTTPDYSPRPVTAITGTAYPSPQAEQPRAATAGGILAYTEQEQRLADARRRAAEEAL